MEDRERRISPTHLGRRAADDTCPLLVFGEETLSNYDLTLEAKKTGGQWATGDLLPLAGTRASTASFDLAGNRGIDFSYLYNGKWGREDGNSKGLSYSSNRWYSLKVEVRGDTFRAYLDGVLQFEQTDARFTHGRICLYTGTRRPGFVGSRSAIRRERCCSRVCRSCRPPATTRLRKPTSARAPAC